MSSIPPPNQPGQPTPNQPASGAQQSQQGLPPTGLQQQMQSLNSVYGQVEGFQDIGFDPRQFQFAQAQGAGTGQLQENQQMGSTSLDQMARNMAQRYGLPIGRGRLVDESGNFMMTPQQLADASGGAVTLGEASAQMNYISQAITRKQNEEQQRKGLAALQTGLGQVQSRGRGSLATLMSNQYQGIADMYANQEYESADFSYYIQKEQLDLQRELQGRAEEMEKRQARQGFLTGIGMTIVSIFSGNYAGVVAGAAQTYGSAEGTGWF
ncbi:MAG: hypothetical protein GY906_23490 [bacterium]|nr:hypothetical protein [bacterium]